jgi:hypothetical protein
MQFQDVWVQVVRLMSVVTQILRFLVKVEELRQVEHRLVLPAVVITTAVQVDRVLDDELFLWHIINFTIKHLFIPNHNKSDWTLLNFIRMFDFI